MYSKRKKKITPTKDHSPSQRLFLLDEVGLTPSISQSALSRLDAPNLSSYWPNISWYWRFVSVNGFSRGSGACAGAPLALPFDLEPEDRLRRVRERLAKREVNLESGELEVEADDVVEGVGEVVEGDGAERRIARRTFSRMGILRVLRMWSRLRRFEIF